MSNVATKAKKPNLSVKSVLNWILDHAMIIVIVLLALYVQTQRDAFLKPASLINIISLTAARLPMALGVAGCIILAGTDLTGGRVAGLTAFVAAILLQRADVANRVLAGGAPANIVLVLLLVMLIGACVGLINGFVMAKFKVHPYIITLAMQMIVYGIYLTVSNSVQVGSFDSSYTTSFVTKPLFQIQTGVRPNGTAIFTVVPMYVLLALIVFGVFARGIFTSGKTTTEHAQRELHTYAEQHETSLADYPDALVQLYARNPDARDFVRDYPKKKDLTPTLDLSNLSGSKTVPLLLQWDERWGYREYNESIIGLAGCGPTCLSMATIYLTGDTTKDPLWMCRFAEQNQFNVPGSGSKWALISEGGRMLGLDVTQIPLDKDRVYRNLDVGNPIIVVVGPGDFTTDGHFLVLTGHSGDKITLNDPNSPANSAKSWDYDTLAGQIQALWVLRRAG